MRVTWDALLCRINGCMQCRLCAMRTNVVPGEGSGKSRIMFVGEGPGRDEDLQGRPFVGAAGQLLDRMLDAIGLKREEVYICNVVKCRPPNNRTPEESEALSCLPFLREQFVLLQPKIIVCLGATAAKYLCDPEIRIARERGRLREKKGVWFLPTYHPAALLRDPPKKKEAWEDLKTLREKYLELFRAGEIAPEAVPNGWKALLQVEGSQGKRAEREEKTQNTDGKE